MSPYKDPDCEDPYGIEEISEKLEEKIKDKIGRVMVLYGIKEIFEKLNALIDVLERTKRKEEI